MTKYKVYGICTPALTPIMSGMRLSCPTQQGSYMSAEYFTMGSGLRGQNSQGQGISAPFLSPISSFLILLVLPSQPLTRPSRSLAGKQGREVAGCPQRRLHGSWVLSGQPVPSMESICRTKHRHTMTSFSLPVLIFLSSSLYYFTPLF